MIKEASGNILNCKEDIIIHQVNVQGIMGGGLARQLANQYPKLEKFYSQHCKDLDNDYNLLKGTVLYYGDYKKTIANLFSQKSNFDTDYIAMKEALNKIKEIARFRNLSICIPYGIGCGIANGDWNFVYKIIETIFNDYDITIYKLKELNKERRL